MSKDPRFDAGAMHEHEEDEAKKDPRRLGRKRMFDEFECPTCSAHNPFTEFGDNDEVTCGYCGAYFIVKITDEGDLTLREG